jgi:ArsR family transcriptional regulator
MTSVTVDESTGVLALIADPVRYRLLTLLAREQMCTCHLVAELGMKQPVVSHHLRVLREAGLVEGSPCGRYTYYRLCPGALDGATSSLQSLADASRTEPRRRPC